MYDLHFFFAFYLELCILCVLVLIFCDYASLKMRYFAYLPEKLLMPASTLLF